MRRNIVFIMVLFLMIVTITPVSAESLDSGKVSLQAAIELAKQNSSQAKQAEWSVSLASYNANIAHNSLIDALYSRAYTVESLTSIRKTADSSKSAYERAQESLAGQIETIGYTMGSLYLSTTLLEKQIELSREAVALNEKALEIEKIKQRLGMSTQLSIAGKEMVLLNSKKELQSCINQVSFNKRTINNLIGRDIDAPLVLTESIIVDKGEPKPWTEVVKLALAKNVDLKHKEIAINDRISDRKDTDGASNTFEIADINLQSAQLALEDAIVTLRKDVKDIYDKLNIDRVALQEKNMSYQVSYRDFLHAKTKHNLGLISDMELKNASILFLTKEVELKSAKNAYFLSKTAYELVEQGIIIN